MALDAHLTYRDSLIVGYKICYRQHAWSSLAIPSLFFVQFLVLALVGEYPCYSLQ